MLVEHLPYTLRVIVFHRDRLMWYFGTTKLRFNLLMELPGLKRACAT